jgi:hypothetical protein
VLLLAVEVHVVLLLLLLLLRDNETYSMTIQHL